MIKIIIKIIDVHYEPRKLFCIGIINNGIRNNNKVNQILKKYSSVFKSPISGKIINESKLLLFIKLRSEKNTIIINYSFFSVYILFLYM